MRAWLAVAVVAALVGPAACSVKKVRFTAGADGGGGGRGDGGGMDTHPVTDAAPRDAAPHDAPARDASAPDTLVADAAAHDAASRDATMRDATGADATTRDAAPLDAGPHDAGPHDAGMHDAGTHDAAASEAGAGGRPGRDAADTDAHDAAAPDGPSSCDVNLVPAMTGPTTPSGAVFSSGSLYSDYDAWHAFDASATSMWISPQAQVPASIGYAWGDGPRLVRAYAITYANGTILSRAPSAWTFEGLLNDAWITLDSRQGEAAWAGFERRVYPVAAPGLYSEYRLEIRDDNDPDAGIVVVSIGNFELIGCPP